MLKTDAGQVIGSGCQEAPSFLQSDLFLELNRPHRGRGPQVSVENRSPSFCLSVHDAYTAPAGVRDFFVVGGNQESGFFVLVDLSDQLHDLSC